MQNISGPRRAIGFPGDKRVPYARRGWEDARLGLPFNYDVAGSRACVAAYEQARLRVLALRGAGLKVPQWKTESGIPSLVRSAYLRTTDINAALNGTGQAYWPIGPGGWLDNLHATA